MAAAAGRGKAGGAGKRGSGAGANGRGRPKSVGAQLPKRPKSPRAKLLPHGQRCTHKKLDGKRCTNPRLFKSDGSREDHCITHAPEQYRRERGFGGAQTGGGRKRVPSAREIVIRKYEEKIEELIDNQLRIALEGQRAVVVPGTAKKSGRVEYVDDNAVQLAALRDALDRVLGRPKATVETTEGAEQDAPEIPRSEERANEVADLLRRAGALDE